MGRVHHRRFAALAVLALLSIFGWSPVAAAADKLAYEIESVGDVVGGCPSEGRPVPIRLRNVGTEVWHPDDRDRLAYHWRDATGRMLIRDGERTLLPGPVAPGQTVDLAARLRFPADPGTYVLQWRMVREGVHWYPLAEIAVRQVVVEGSPDPFVWSLRVERVPSFAAGETADVRVRIDNGGCAAWGPSASDALTYRWLDDQGTVVVPEGLRTPLPDIPRGASASVSVRVIAPQREGTFRLSFEPVREGVTWFGPSSDAPEVSVDVGPGPLRWASLVEPAIGDLAARSVVTVPVELRNEGTATWSSKTGDHVSYRWRDGQGTVVGEGIRTALPHAVEPGQTLRLRLRVAAPDVVGDYRFEVRPVREHVRWFGPAVGGVADVDVHVKASALEWAVVDVDVPRWFWVGRTAVIEATIRNEGSSPWSPNTADRLTYRLWDAGGELIVAEGRRTQVPRVVAPGQSITLVAQVPGPPRSGEYTLELRMVREHVAWFGPPSHPTSAEIPVSVWWQSTMLGGLLALAVLAFVVLRRHPRTQGRAAGGDRWVWPLWVAACVWLTSEAFSELSGIEFWEAGRIVGISCGALAGAAVAALGRAHRVTSLVVAGFIATLTVADLAYTDFFGSLVPFTALAAVHHLRDATTSVVSLMQPSFAWVWLLPATGLLLAAGTRKLGSASGWDRWAPTVLLAAAGLPAVLVIGSVMSTGVGNRVFSEFRNAGRLSVVGAHLFQVARAIRDIGGVGELSETERSEVEDFYIARQAQREAARSGEPLAAGSPLNVVLIQVEALQQWAVDAEVDGQRVMPTLHFAGADAMVFDAVFDQTAQGRTSDAEYLVLASNHALAEGALSFLRADSDFLTLAHVLADDGYTTLSAHPYRRGFWNRAALHPRYGFTSSSFRRELGPGAQVGWGLADGPFLERMAARLESTPEPFFAFLITLSLHHPYEDFPVALRELEMGALEDTAVGNYLHAMHHFDSSLSAFMRRLEDAGLAERTMVVIYGDHVTGIGEPPEVLELAGVSSWSPSTATLQHRVPTIIWMPGRSPHVQRGRSSRVGGQIDIGPTILELLGRSAPPSFVGRTLTGGPGWTALPGGSAIGPDRMLVVGGEAIGVDGACFDYPRGSLRPLEDCASLEQRATAELQASRAVLDHDLFRSLRTRSP